MMRFDNEEWVDKLNFTQSVFYGLVHVERILHLYKLFEEEIKDEENIFLIFIKTVIRC